MDNLHSQLIEALSLETINLQYETLNINGVKIIYGYPTIGTKNYINRVYGQFKSQPYLSSSDNIGVTLIEGIRDDGLFVAKLTDVQIDYEYLYNTKSIRRAQNDNLYFSEYGFLHADISALDQSKTILSVGDIPHIGISCLIRKVLLSKYLELFPNLVVFHSNAIVDTRDNSCLMFSGEEVDGIQGKKGKTTMTLSSIIQPNSPFAYLANDDFILTSSNNEIKWLPLPAEINVGAKTMQAIQEAGYNLETEKEEFEFYGENHFMLTAGEISDSGFNVTSSFNRIKYWFVMDLNSSSADYTIAKITPDEVESEILKTIKKSRMGQLYLPDVLGEQESSLGNQFMEEREDTIETNAKNIFEQLKRSGTQFLKISGGLDRDKLYKLLKDFTELEQ